ncbi:hypothetical protein ACFWGD_09325 [Corynebacterium sp. NPDC060344]|uniref:hypothetical protein n=1 Tax=Corynebacterium sp. NPDC060344 TaxID=3347101 RepID=UPI0036508B63
MLENKYDKHRRHLEENQISQIKYQRAQLDAQRDGVQLTQEQLDQANRQHEELMAAQREQADQARRAQWATWIQTEDGKRYLKWKAGAVAWRKMMKTTLGTWNDAWTAEFDAAHGRFAVSARGDNQWIGSPTFKTVSICLGILGVLTLLKGLLFGFGAISTIILLGSIAGAAFCAWKHITDWTPRNDAEREKVTAELHEALGHDVLDTYPSWPGLFTRQSEIEDAVDSLRSFMDGAADTFPTTYPAIPSHEFTTVDPRWPASVRATHDELRKALG